MKQDFKLWKSCFCCNFKQQIYSNFINKYDNIVIDSMFLPIMNEIYEKIDYKILVLLDDEKRMERILKRDNLNEEYYKKRDNYSLDYSKFNFDLVIDNNVDFKVV